MTTWEALDHRRVPIVTPKRLVSVRSAMLGFAFNTGTTARVEIDFFYHFEFPQKIRALLPVMSRLI